MRLMPTSLDQKHEADDDEELLMEFIIGEIIKDCTKTINTMSSLGL
jgi:hypothetical protein